MISSGGGVAQGGSAGPVERSTRGSARASPPGLRRAGASPMARMTCIFILHAHHDDWTEQSPGRESPHVLPLDVADLNRYPSSRSGVLVPRLLIVIDFCSVQHRREGGGGSQVERYDRCPDQQRRRQRPRDGVGNEGNHAFLSMICGLIPFVFVFSWRWISA